MDHIDKIKRIINVWETGKEALNVTDIYIFKDGKNESRQLTVGSGLTEQGGGIKKALEYYLLAQPKDPIAPFVPLVGKTPLVANQEFRAHFGRVLDSPDWRGAFERVWAENYITPALEWATRHGFTLPLSILCVVDSWVHSGRVPDFLRARFPELPPSKGGNEKLWVIAYCKARGIWLANHSRRILRKTNYRVNDILRAAENGNWDLSKPFLANGKTVI
jgi:chitosanase